MGFVTSAWDIRVVGTRQNPLFTPAESLSAIHGLMSQSHKQLPNEDDLLLHIGNWFIYCFLRL